jgi:hypothetical protein
MKDKITLPILIDSTDFLNDIKTQLTSVNNYNVDTNNDLKLIFVIDKNTKIPIYFKYITENITDNYTLINTKNELLAYDLNIESIIMDAEYCSFNNLSQLTKNNLSIITRMPANRKEYIQLMGEYGADLKQPQNAIAFGDRGLFGKKVEINMFGGIQYVYIMLDIQKEYNETLKSMKKYVKEEDKDVQLLEKNIYSAGKFILISSKNYEIKEIIQLYYTRQAIQQLFDISKNYYGIMPLTDYNKEIIRGILLISFVATVVYSYLSHVLSDSTTTVNGALYVMRNLLIKLYQSTKVLEDLTKEQKNIFEILNLEYPFPLESDNTLQKEPFLPNKKKKRTS